MRFATQAKKGCLTALSLAALMSPAHAQQSVAVLVDGAPVRFDQPPIVRGGRVLVPIRGVFERMGSEVVYLPATRQVRATHQGTMVDLTIGSRSAFIDGHSVYLDTPATEIGGRTLVPLRFLSQSLGAEVRWDGANRTVYITSQQPPPVAMQPMAPQETPLQVLAPLNEQPVPPYFQVVVATGPRARIDFSVEVLPPGPGPFLHDRIERVSADADMNGRVVIPVRLHAPSGSRVLMSVSSVDGMGRHSRTESVSAYQQ